MPFFTRDTVLGFVCGALLLLLVEAGAAFVMFGGFVDPDAGPTLPAMTRLGDLQGSFTDLQGNSFSFAELRGKVVLINLWATWCPPCRAEMPSLDRLWKEFEGNGDIRVLCISTEKREEVRAHPLAREVAMPLYVFEPEAPVELRAEGLPTTYIFNREGKVVFGHTGMAKWDSPEVVAFLKSLAGGRTD